MFDLPDKITYWVHLGNDGLGGSSWDGPNVVDSRNALRQEQYTDINGNTRRSKAVSYTNAVLNVGDYIYLGESVELTPPQDSFDIKAQSNTPSGAGSLRKLWL